jgi:hypothetical protein
LGRDFWRQVGHQDVIAHIVDQQRLTRFVLHLDLNAKDEST